MFIGTSLCSKIKKYILIFLKLMSKILKLISLNFFFFLKITNEGVFRIFCGLCSYCLWKVNGQTWEKQGVFSIFWFWGMWKSIGPNLRLLNLSFDWATVEPIKTHDCWVNQCQCLIRTSIQNSFSFWMIVSQLIYL